MRGRAAGQCHWRGCILARIDGSEFCEAHKKAAEFHGHSVKNPEPVTDGWDGYQAWMQQGSWEAKP